MIVLRSNSIILHGTGMIGEKFYTKYHDRYEIKYCIDSRDRNDFHGLKVVKPDEVSKEFLGGLTIVITVHQNAYPEIKNYYERNGLIEFENFIYWGDLNKKLAIFYGNCHFIVLNKYFMQIPDFTRTYTVRSYWVYGYGVEKDGISSIEKNHCDLLITQDIREDNSTEVISAGKLISQMPMSCRVVVIPNLYSFNLFFPQVEKVRDYSKRHMKNIEIDNPKRSYELKWESGFTECNDIYIQKIIEGNSTEEEVLSKMYDVDLISHSRIQQCFREGIEKIKKREQQCDIKISDFILENYKNKQLFYDPQHPTEVVICEIGKRVLRCLGINDIPEVYVEPTLNDTELFIYECVRQALGLNYIQKYIRVGKLHATLTSSGGVTREEYIDDVVRWSSEG